MMKKKSKTVDLDILPSGEVRFSRSDLESNEALMEILSEVTNIDDIREFFDGSKSIEVIIGDESFCG